MIYFRHGDILNPGRHFNLTVIPVNCEGVMGKGLALSFKNKHPLIFEEYKEICKNGLLRVGNPVCLSGYVMFPTKEYWRNPSELHWIVRGLSSFFSSHILPENYSIAWPKLGCGLGGLKWENVLPIMVHYLENSKISNYIYLGE